MTLIKRPKNPVELQAIITAFLMGNFDTEYMYTFKTKEIVFESTEEIPWTLDGEFGGQHDFVKINNQKQALKFMIEAKEEEKLSEQRIEGE